MTNTINLEKPPLWKNSFEKQISQFSDHDFLTKMQKQNNECITNNYKHETVIVINDILVTKPVWTK